MAGYLRSAGSFMRDRTLRLLGALMSLNDPNWGRRPGGGNQGPPDLDELWRNFNRKLDGLFGRRGGGGDGEGKSGGSSPGRPGGGVGLLVGIVLVIWLASGFYIVNEGQRGVILRFGKFVESTEPGPRWHLPYPIESVEVVNMAQVRTVEIGYRNNVKSKVLRESLMLTDDENIVDVQFAVQYVLKSANDYLFNSRGPDEAVLQAAETAIREVVGKSSMDLVLYEGRADVAARIRQLTQIFLDRYGTGIAVSTVTMQNAQPPEQVQAAFDDAVKAGQDRERQKNEGEAYANDVVPKARGAASRQVEEAEGYRQRVIEQAEGDASRFRLVLAEYTKAPQVTRDRLYLESMQQVLSNSSKVLVDQKAGNNLMYLPLDRMMQQANPAVVQPSAKSVNPAPAPDASNARSREAFRGREREAR